MLGLHGIGLSQLKNISVARMKIAFWIAVPAFIALVCPNTLRILSRHEPATSAWVESGPARRCDSQNPHPLGTVAGAGGRSGDHRGCRDTLILAAKANFSETLLRRRKAVPDSAMAQLGLLG